MVYSVPEECKKLIQTSLLENEKVKVPESIKNIASKVKFEGSDDPSIPIYLRFAESISVLKALEGLSLVDLIQKKYNTDVEEITINTDQAQDFLMPNITGLVKDNQPIARRTPEYYETYNKLFKEMDFHQSFGMFNMTATNIYKTKDDRYYHIHGSLQPQITQEALGVHQQEDQKSTLTYDEAVTIYAKAVSKFDAVELDTLINDKYGQSGSICYTQEEFKQTEQYKATEHIGLFETHHIEDGTPAQWWSLEEEGSVERPLAGLKVLDLTRIIAAPLITRTLAEYGASVMRVTSPNNPDFSLLHADMNYGKWSCELDFKKEEDCEKLYALVREADIVVQGYRPFSLDKYGIGKEDLLAMARERGRGIIYVRENCYGWYGPWINRTGWQQISDACCGVSKAFGEALGLKDEAVTPILPNSDFCTGSAGVSAIIQALVERSTKGGSYVIDTALNYYNIWLMEHIGVYDKDVWAKLWESKGKPVPRHFHHLVVSFTEYMGLLQKHSPTLWNPNFFERRETLDPSVKIGALKPIVQFSGKTRTGFNVPTRGNGLDAPIWPKDLSVKTVVVDI